MELVVALGLIVFKVALLIAILLLLPLPLTWLERIGPIRCWMCPAILPQSMSLLDIVRAQADVWNIVCQPVGFFVFVVAGLAEAQRIPFDLAEAEGTPAVRRT